MLLSRVAENLYWSARYLERAEDTARIVLRHTDLLVDLPTSVPLRWDPLLAITGAAEAFAEGGAGASEREIVSFLIDDRSNFGSILMCVAQARENLRTSREVIPRDVWQIVNDLHLFTSARHQEGVLRSTRPKFLSHVIGECQRLVGALSGTMSRDEAYSIMRLGRNVERSDMTTRVLDTAAATLLGSATDYDNLQWAGVLKQLSAFQMFRRSQRTSIDGPAVVKFCLTDRSFPRAVAHCLDEIEACVSMLPVAPQVAAAAGAARGYTQQIAVEDLTSERLHIVADELQIHIAAIHTAASTAYFPVRN